MKLVRIPRILKKLYPSITWEIDVPGPTLHLTFDDGPTPDVTQQVLSILEQHHACATFFSIGRNVERHPDIYDRVLKAGHTTGNHTYSHLKGWFTKDKEYYDDIALAAQFIQSRLYRPAYGMITPSQVKYLQHFYRIVLWDIMSYDFDRNISPERCLENVTGNARNGSVIVFHDSVKAAENMLFALPRVLEHFSEKGFHFRSIPEE